MELQDILSGAKLNERFKSGDSLESNIVCISFA
jgi:translation elongation factor P/translation initiation factor 5A